MQIFRWRLQKIGETGWSWFPSFWEPEGYECQTVAYLANNGERFEGKTDYRTIYLLMQSGI